MFDIPIGYPGDHPIIRQPSQFGSHGMAKLWAPQNGKIVLTREFRGKPRERRFIRVKGHDIFGD